MPEPPRPFEPSGISFFGAAFLGASSRNGSKGSSRQFQKESPRRQRSGTNRSDFSGCFGAPSAKTVSAVWLRPLTSCKPLDVIFTHQRVRQRKRKATSKKGTTDGSDSGDAAWNSTVASFAIAVARRCGGNRPSMAASGAGLRIDCGGCLRRFYRHVYLVGVSLHFAPWDQCHVLAQPDQLWADRGLCLSPRFFRASLFKPGGTDHTQPHRAGRVHFRRVRHSEIRETKRIA